jgi:hypothetical protein
MTDETETKPEPVVVIKEKIVHHHYHGGSDGRSHRTCIERADDGLRSIVDCFRHSF